MVRVGRFEHPLDSGLKGAPLLLGYTRIRLRLMVAKVGLEPTPN